MFRLFVAIALPDFVKQTLLSVACGVPGARWMEEDQMHFTLRFIGEVDGKMYRAIEDALSGIEAQALTITVKGVGHFPPRGRPRILWAGVEKTEPLLALKTKIDHALRRLGVESDRRKFFPHITLARLRQAQSARVGGFLVENGLLRCPPFTVDEFHLFSSAPQTEGARYRIEVTYPLLLPADASQTL